MFASYFKIHYDNKTDLVYLSVKETDHTVTEHCMAGTYWNALVEMHRDHSEKTIRLKLPLTDTVNRFYEVPTREFMLLVADYDTKEQEDAE